MSDNDLERKLRSQPGPRDEGYAPTRLPMTLEEARSRSSSPTPLVRGGLFVGAALAGVLAVAVAAVVLSGPTDNGVGNGSSPASPSAEPSGSSGFCAPEDVTLSAEPWGGAAGSRGTIVTATLTPGRDGCQIASEPVGQITDAGGTVLVSSPPDGTPGTVSLLAGHPQSLSVVWSNWCASAPAEPLTLSIDLGLGSMMPVPVLAGGDDPVPPCSGGGSSTLGAHLQGELQ